MLSPRLTTSEPGTSGTSIQSAVGVLHLQPRGGSRRENRQEAGVVMGVDPGRAGRCGGIVDELRQRHGPVAQEALQIVTGQVQAQPERPQQPLGQDPQPAGPLVAERLVAGEDVIGQPLVRPQ